jgi:hypothetical protein
MVLVVQLLVVAVVAHPLQVLVMRILVQPVVRVAQPLRQALVRATQQQVEAVERQLPVPILVKPQPPMLHLNIIPVGVG